MKQRFKYIKWLFDLKNWLAGGTALVLCMFTEDWIRIHYSFDLTGDTLRWVLLLTILIIVHFIYEFIEKCIRKVIF